MVDLLGWTMDRTADIPKSHRFTFGQRLDNETLEGLMVVVDAIYTKGEARRQRLTYLNLVLEKLRVLWRLVQARNWINERQLLFVNERIDEVGRMAGGWIKQHDAR